MSDHKVEFVDVAAMAQWIQKDGAGMVDFLEEDFKKWQSFDKIPRVASHTPFGVIELMPTSDNVTYSFKYVNGHPSNPARGYQTVTAFGLLADVDNGYPVFLAEMTLLTALRTAAVSAMVAKHLARKDSRKMAMVGTGSQSEFQALGMRAVLGIEDLAVYDVDRVHLNAIGGDCPGKTELESEILDRSTVFVEFPPQTRIEGEIQQKDPDFPVVEFWKVLTGEEPGRTSDEQITLFDSVGGYRSAAVH